MKIVIAGGDHQAEYIISMLKGKGNNIIVINDSKEVADTILKRTRVPVFVGNPIKRYALEESNAHDADVFIALSDSDTNNYASCELAKNCFGARKTICLVNNPKNVDVYEKLGIDSAISSSYLLGQSVRSETTFEDIIKSVSLENDKVVMVEAVVLSKYRICGLTLKDCKFPPYASVACIYRTPDVIIPKGDTMLLSGDKLMILCAPNDQKRVSNFIKAGKEGTK